MKHRGELFHLSKQESLKVVSIKMELCVNTFSISVKPERFPYASRSFELFEIILRFDIIETTGDCADEKYILTMGKEINSCGEYYQN